MYDPALFADGRADDFGLYAAVTNGPNFKNTPGPAGGDWERKSAGCTPGQPCPVVKQRTAVNRQAPSGDMTNTADFTGAWVIARVDLIGKTQAKDSAYRLGQPATGVDIEREFVIVAKPLAGTPPTAEKPAVALLEIYGFRVVSGSGSNTQRELFRVRDADGTFATRYIRQCHPTDTTELGARFVGCDSMNLLPPASGAVSRASMLPDFFTRTSRAAQPLSLRTDRELLGLWMTCAAGCCYADLLF